MPSIPQEFVEGSRADGDGVMNFLNPPARPTVQSAVAVKIYLEI
jgi:hypothetical protein